MEEYPIISTQNGKLRGKMCKNVLTGKPFYSFLGIPYAKPPLGELRFVDPVLAEPWDGVRDALEESEITITRGLFPGGELLGSEDSLYLNVHIPELPQNSAIQKRAVMCYIHGGGYTFGSGSPQIYGGDFLMSEDVIVVTMNYRMGVLGFLRFDDSSLGVTGNAGFKDIVCSLEWIQRNIAKFGGDHDRVTIFGVSSGAGTVHHLQLMVPPRNIFHRVGIHSGTATGFWGLTKIDKGIQLAKLLGCQSENEREVLEFLRNVPAEDIVTKAVYLLNPENFKSGDFLPAGPVLEKPDSKEPIISRDPRNALNSGYFSHVPSLFGTTSDEGLFHYHEIPRDNLDAMINGLLIPSTWNILPENTRIVQEKLKEYYFSDCQDKDTTFLAYLRFLGDIEFIDTIMDAMYGFLDKSDQPAYYFKFRLDARCNSVKLREHIPAKGTSHGDELGYIFRNSTHIVPEPGSIEHTTIINMARMWANFAKTGNPNLPNPLPGIDWKPMKKDQFHYIDIGDEVKTGIVNPDQKMLDFFHGLIKEYGTKNTL